MFRKLATCLVMATIFSGAAISQLSDITLVGGDSILTVKAGAFSDPNSPEYGRADYRFNGPSGEDVLGRIIFGFKIDNVPREHLFGGPSTLVEVLPNGNPNSGYSDTIRITMDFPDPQFQFQAMFSVRDMDGSMGKKQGRIHVSMTGQNFTNLWRFVHLYALFDLDLEGTPENDRWVGNGRLEEVSYAHAESDHSLNGGGVIAAAASSFALFQDDLPNFTTGGTSNPGDWMLGFDHFAAIGPNGDRRGHNFTAIGMNVKGLPELGTWIALTLGSGTLIRKMRKRPR